MIYVYAQVSTDGQSARAEGNRPPEPQENQHRKVPGTKDGATAAPADAFGCTISCRVLFEAGAVAASILAASALVFAGASTTKAEGLRPYRVVGDAIPESLTGAPGDPARGRANVASRQTGLCLLCHSAPLPEEKFQGTIGPDLKGVGSRYTEGQLRLRIVDSSLAVPGTIMPAYYRIDGLDRVAPAFRGKTVLTAEQIEDVVAFIKTLRDDNTAR
jgi:sulfur-oxidizing protein SoxX